MLNQLKKTNIIHRKTQTQKNNQSGTKHQNKTRTKKSRDLLKQEIHSFIFDPDTSTGWFFDITILVLIVFSIIIVMLESVKSLDALYHDWFVFAEWAFTILFTIEYGLRVYAVKDRWKYISSFFGIVDLLAILPTYISLFSSGSRYLLTVRALRLLRVFRIFKLVRYSSESQELLSALKHSRAKIVVFLGAVLTSVVIIGTIMYLIEGGQNDGFSSIPQSIYWAIVTITTVGYGDISPITPLGQTLAAILMILGYGIIAVPTGIVSAELASHQHDHHAHSHTHDHEYLSTSSENNKVNCRGCWQKGHDVDAVFCKYCGNKL